MQHFRLCKLLRVVVVFLLRVALICYQLLQLLTYLLAFRLSCATIALFLCAPSPCSFRCHSFSTSDHTVNRLKFSQCFRYIHLLEIIIVIHILFNSVCRRSVKSLSLATQPVRHSHRAPLHCSLPLVRALALVATKTSARRRAACRRRREMRQTTRGHCRRPPRS
jgi:hypothetical protein